jgi:hypothetical protein
VVVPVGGADKLSTFVSLIGANQLNVAVLMDVAQNEQQRITNLQKNGYLGKNAVVQVGQFIGQTDADTEDLFTPAFYLKLVNGAFESELPKRLAQKDLVDKNPRIVRRVGAYFKAESITNGKFNHYRPAAYLLREQTKLLGSLDTLTVERASELFTAVNKLLS